MPEQQIKFYQAGSFAVGNRLLDPEERTVQASTERSNALTSGHRACQGCGEALGARYAMDAAMRASGGRLVAANATGCVEFFSTPYPGSWWQLPWFHSLFGNAPAVAAGVAAGLRATGRDDVRVIGRGAAGASPMGATAARSTSGSAASRACSSATTTCSTSATTTRAT